jgi:hypothetical protein
MKTLNILPALLLAGVSSAQTPTGFSPAVVEKLDVTFGTKNIATPGQPMSKSDTSRQPTIGLTGTANGTYIWMLIGEFAQALTGPVSLENDAEECLHDRS